MLNNIVSITPLVKIIEIPPPHPLPLLRLPVEVLYYEY
jgi:hypothetical protein